MEEENKLEDIKQFFKKNSDKEDVKKYLSELSCETKLDRLKRQKGDLITNIELFQNQLQYVNQEIVSELGLLKKDATSN